MTTNALRAALDRTNLVRSLEDPEQRRRYLHPRPHTLRQLLAYMYRPVFKQRDLVAASAVYAVSSGLLPLLSVVIVWWLTRLLTLATTTPATMLLASGAYALAFALCTVVSLQLKHRFYSRFIGLRLEMVNDCFNQYTTMDLGLFENAAFLDDFDNWGVALSGNEQGVEGSYHRIFDMGGELVSLILLSAILALVHPLLPLAGLATILVVCATRLTIARYRHRFREQRRRLMRRLSRFVGQASDFRFGKDLRLYRLRGRFEDMIEPLIEELGALTRRVSGRELRLAPIEALALVLAEGLALLLLLRGLMQGRLALADFVMLLTAISLYIVSLTEFSSGIVFVREELMYFGDTVDLLEAELVSSHADGELPGTAPIAIELEDVSFAYPGSERLVLEGINLRIEAGERVALVGVNGAGKTTLVKLITGLYQPTSGRIRYDGVDGRELGAGAVFKLFGAVFQEVEPLALTIAENVAADDEGVDRARVMDVLERVGLGDKVRALPEGIDTTMLRVIDDDGALFSGGENQRLAIARALYRESARAMVMDEPTAALDALAEERIYRDFDEILAGRSALFISHRLASTRFCDRIVLLDGGSIRQQGRHEQLVETPGLYRDMFRTQASYYQEAAQQMAAAAQTSEEASHDEEN